MRPLDPARAAPLPWFLTRLVVCVVPLSVLQAKAKATVPGNVEALDSDVAAEFRRVAEGQYSERAPVQVANLVKEFGGGKVAVNNVSLIIEDRMTFG